MGVVFVAATADWAGWATGTDALSRVWPRMTPWSAVLLAALGAAILVQSGRPTPARVWAGRGLAAAAGVVAVMFLAEYVAGSSFVLDQLWFSEAVRELPSAWPGRPSPQSASSIVLLSIGVAVIRLDRSWTRVVWPLSLGAAAVPPGLAILAYLFDATSLLQIAGSTLVGVATAPCLMLLVAATLVARPDRDPVAWLWARPDRRSLIRLGSIVAGLPILVALSRLVFLILGLRGDEVWVLAIAVGTVIAAAATFYLSQREETVLLEKEQITRRNATVEVAYRMLADNAVDVIICLRGKKVVWASPSAVPAFGWTVEQLVGADLPPRICPDDLDAVYAALQRIDHGASAVARFRIATAEGGYHWVDGHGKPYIDPEGNADGVIFAVRIVDEQVQAQKQLEIEKERFEAVVGNAPSAISVCDSDTATPGPTKLFAICSGKSRSRM